MPGLSVAQGELSTSGDALVDSLEATRFFEWYDVRTAASTDGVFVGRTEYDGYPIRRVETEHGTAYLEGYLYDVADVQAHLERVAGMIARGDVEGLRDWVADRDGEYLIAVHHGEDVALLTDPYGRLPTYHATVDGTAVCSRELRFVREFSRSREGDLSLDRLSIAQLLLFGYLLGTRTTFEGVRAVPPGSLVRLDGGVSVDSVFELDYGGTRHADRSLEENATILADRLRTACRNRAVPGRETVVSLSGGLDSRLVAAAYRAADVPVRAATFERVDGATDGEIGAAAEVADRLDLDWSTHPVDDSPERRETLLSTMQGMNYLGMAHILAFFEQLRAAHGTPVYATGDGGDKAFVDLTPSATFESDDELLQHVIEANRRLSVREAAAVAGVEEDRLRESVARRLQSYPESDPGRRYVHFLVRERGLNFLIQGEDRNRYFVWDVAPCWARPVFEYAMQCPDDQKRYRRLHAALFDRLAPELVDVTYPDFGAPISSNRYRAKQFVYDYLERHPAIRSTVVDLVSGEPADTTELVETIRSDLDALDGTAVSRPAVAEILADSERYSPTQLQALGTATALAADLGADAPEAERPSTPSP